MREIFKSGSVRGLIATLGLLPQKKKVRYGLYSTSLWYKQLVQLKIVLNRVFKNNRYETASAWQIPVV